MLLGDPDRAAERRGTAVGGDQHPRTDPLAPPVAGERDLHSVRPVREEGHPGAAADLDVPPALEDVQERHHQRVVLDPQPTVPRGIRQECGLRPIHHREPHDGRAVRAQRLTESEGGELLDGDGVEQLACQHLVAVLASVGDQGPQAELGHGSSGGAPRGSTTGNKYVHFGHDDDPSPALLSVLLIECAAPRRIFRCVSTGYHS